MKKDNALTLFEATPQNIWNYKQNHPELVIKDLQQYGVDAFIVSLVRQSMLCRGINKWLKVRRDLIAYKKIIKHQIKDLDKIIPSLKEQMKNTHVSYKEILLNPENIHQLLLFERKHRDYMIAKEKLKLLQEIRGNLKKMCMTDRWQIWEGKHIEEMNTIKASD